MAIFEMYEIKNVLSARKINITGCFHVGAHECEELDGLYNNLGVKPEDIVWIEALPDKVSNASNRGIPNVFHSVITDKDDEDIEFNVANYTKYSSTLKLASPLKLASQPMPEPGPASQPMPGSEYKECPEVVFVDQLCQKSTTIDTFFERNMLDGSKYNFWKINIRGCELQALKGATKSIKNAMVIYVDVNSKEHYKNGALITEIDDFLKRFNFKRMLTTMTIHKCGEAIYILDTPRLSLLSLLKGL
jgi:hypothetical protein